MAACFVDDGILSQHGDSGNGIAFGESIARSALFREVQPVIDTGVAMAIPVESVLANSLRSGWRFAAVSAVPDADAAGHLPPS
ncbi:unnamed protein product [Heligmosomoides polygyrus]|uniref:Peptidase_S8 domain-containing protein n=1 Tax=Heligmosomoides polygyrus TaxID=6339 RepID=A0A183FUS9_HELPZ|nr:unnamed protein product [Heligmosomoides polygyrus]